jgi:hypothetical protein
MMLSGEAVAVQIMEQNRRVEVVRLHAGDFFGDKVFQHVLFCQLSGVNFLDHDDHPALLNLLAQILRFFIVLPRQALAGTERVPAEVSAVNLVSMLKLEREVMVHQVGAADEIRARAMAYSQRVAQAGGVANLRAQEAAAAASGAGMQAKDGKRVIGSWDRKRDLQVLGTLGQGSFATVQLVREKQSGETYALKCLQRHQIELDAQKAHVLNERRVLAALDSPFLVKLVATTKDEYCLGLVLEVCLAGEMLTFLQVW